MSENTAVEGGGRRKEGLSRVPRLLGKETAVRLCVETSVFRTRWGIVLCSEPERQGVGGQENAGRHQLLGEVVGSVLVVSGLRKAPPPPN